MITFYRVETASGEGPYHGGCVDLSHIWETYGVNWMKHPGPYEDERLSPQWRGLIDCHRWYFGFTSKRALKRWFYGAKARDALARMGFRVSVYRVPAKHLRRGSMQAVMFTPAAARVASFALSDI